MIIIPLLKPVVLSVITYKQKLLNVYRDTLIFKWIKVTSYHIFANSIIVSVEEIQASRDEKQGAVEVQRELEALAMLEFPKIQTEVAKKLHDSQIKVITHLNESHVKLVFIQTKKTMNELINRYIEDNRLLVKRLEIMKNESNVFIFISLSKIFIVQK